MLNLHHSLRGRLPLTAERLTCPLIHGTIPSLQIRSTFFPTRASASLLWMNSSTRITGPCRTIAGPPMVDVRSPCPRSTRPSCHHGTNHSGLHLTLTVATAWAAHVTTCLSIPLPVILLRLLLAELLATRHAVTAIWTSPIYLCDHPTFPGAIHGY